VVNSFRKHGVDVIKMKFFNLFKKTKLLSSVDNAGLFFHEDDYCQIELSPIENLSLFSTEADKINDLAEKTFDGSGYTDIYVRNAERIKLEERKIHPDQLEEIIKITDLGKALSVKTGYGQTYRIEATNTIGYGKDYSAIYFDFKDHMVSHIWLTGHFSINQEKLAECLFQIGQKWSLLLMDWNQTVSVDLSDMASIKKYLGNE
jgi:hypothetical protein